MTNIMADGICIIFTFYMFLSNVMLQNVFHMNSLVNDELKNNGLHWALLVAGSNGWYNYRHQVHTLVTSL